jgi:predicted lipoprotein
MAAKPKSNLVPVPRWLRWSALAVAAAVASAFFPLFHLVPLRGPGDAPAGGAVELPVFAAKFWAEQLLPACRRATEATTLVAALRRDPAAAIEAHAHKVGLGGTAYFFVRGEGRVVARDKNVVRLALGDSDEAVVALQTGRIFGNAVRDGTGLLDVNRFPSLEEFNALAAELNHLVEARVLPVLRDRAPIGARVAFAGCAEAAEPGAGQPLLTLVPVLAEVR